MEQKKAITFDFGGTLAYGALDKENYQRALLDYIFRLGYSGGRAKLSKARNAMLERLRHAREKNREIRFEDLYQSLLLDLELDPTKETIHFIEQLYYNFFKIEIVPGIREMLSNLSKRYNLAIISNVLSNVSRLALKKFELEQYFDYIVLSRDLGIRKPDPEIFNFTLRTWGIAGEDAIHVGDSLENDVKGAKKVGMKTVWIQGEDENTNIQPDYVISKVTDLPTLLKNSSKIKSK